MTSGSPARDQGRLPARAGRRAPRGSDGAPLGEPQPLPEPTPAKSAALVISRALGADGTPPPPPRRAPVAAALGALLLAAGASGYIAGDSGSPPAKPRTVEAGALRLSLPPGWQRRRPGEGIEAVAARPLVAGPSGDGTPRIVAAELPREGLGLLPNAALARLDGLSTGEPVRLGDLHAARYRAVESEAPRRRLTLYASATSRGLALVACAAPPALGGRFMRRCESVAATLSLARGRAVRAVASDDVAKINRVIRRLDARRAAARRSLRSARSGAIRVRIVRALAAAHGRAARALERLPARSEARRAGTPVIHSLRGVERGYRALAGAAGRGDRRREQAARRGVRRRDRELRRAVGRL